MNRPGRVQRVWLGGLLTLSIGLGGCSSTPPQPGTQAPTPATLYDYRLLDQRGQTLTLPQLADALRDYDVVFLGEFHGNHAAHLLQAQLQAALYARRPQQLLSMEQFERQQQALLDRYLDGEIGEAYLINEAPAWDNYAASYRPLVEFAKQHLLPVVAANAPGDIVRCIGRHGETYPQRLPANERGWIAATPFADIPGYEATFDDWLQQNRALSPQKARNSFLAQLTRDNTMAESIVRALQAYPGYQVLHLNGAFHSQNRQGTVAALTRLMPSLKIAVLTPLHSATLDTATLTPEDLAQDLAQGDFVYLLQPQPPQYVHADYRRQRLQQAFKQADTKSCR